MILAEAIRLPIEWRLAALRAALETVRAFGGGVRSVRPVPEATP